MKKDRMILTGLDNEHLIRIIRICEHELEISSLRRKILIVSTSLNVFLLSALLWVAL